MAASPALGFERGCGVELHAIRLTTAAAAAQERTGRIAAENTPHPRGDFREDWMNTPDLHAFAKGSTRYRWVICALLFLITTINYMDRNILGRWAMTVRRRHRGSIIAVPEY